ncbi:YpfB family protein [Thermaerobacillus caldiproteolyticus]|nr:YpfB family protein [Anoxybacillus caldiproteolyticus]QPA33009.1 YpfB family protein [Anoxybacillus caldiproteolyticus]
MKRIEQLLLKVVVIQFIFLFIAQCLLLYTPLAPYLGKVYEYEGVSKQEKTKTMETIVDQ